MNIIELIDTASEIGSIATSNGPFLHGLARKIEETGKTLNELSVNELAALTENYRKEFNKIHA